MELGELEALLDRLLEEDYYSGDALNSEGRKLLERIIRIALKNGAPISKIAYKVRRNPTRLNVAKFREELIGWILGLKGIS